MTDPNLYQKARSDVAGMLGYDLDALTSEQSMRVDVATALRVLLDTQSGRLVRGESLDARELLMASEALSRLLPPAALAAPPSEHRDDPRQAMWELYKQMRERGEIGLKALPPEGGHQHRIDELEAENERLRAQLGLAPALPDVATLVERAPRGGSTAVDPSEADITPPGEIGGECYAGIRPGPDDPPRRSPPVIEGRAVPNPPAASAAPQSSAAPQYDYSRERGWRDHVLPDGTITSTPMSRGRWWGPV